VIVTPVDDTLAEGPETVSLTLAAPSGYTLGTATAAVTIVDNDTIATKIHDIQGTGATFALGGSQTIEGIVVSKFSGTGTLQGFYVEEENADWDTNSLTSEGIFVYDPTGLFTGTVGNKVQVTGTVGEFITTSTNNIATSGSVTSSLTQLATLTSVVNLGATHYRLSLTSFCP
jgi:predicted extracellular nuclease